MKVPAGGADRPERFYSLAGRIAPGMVEGAVKAAMRAELEHPNGTRSAPCSTRGPSGGRDCPYAAMPALPSREAMDEYRSNLADLAAAERKAAEMSTHIVLRGRR